MLNPMQSRRVDRHPARSLALATFAAAGLLATVAFAAPPPAAVVFADLGQTGGGAATPASPLPAVRSYVSIGPVHARAAQNDGAGRLLSATPRPKDAASGLYLVDAIGATWGNGQADIKVSDIIDTNAGGTTGDLKIALWATSVVPALTSGTFTYYQLALADLDAVITGGTDTGGVDTGEIAYAPPNAPGCYYMSVVLISGTHLADIRTFTRGGTASAPESNGFVEFPLNEPSGSTCPVATSCSPTSSSGCLLSSRFQVSAAYDNTTTGSGSASVLSFTGTRAESDESVFFYFTDSSNFEMGVKVLDACAINNSFWVFIGGLTNQGWGVEVVDTLTGNHKGYLNNNGTTTVTVADTTALPCP